MITRRQRAAITTRPRSAPARVAAALAVVAVLASAGHLPSSTHAAFTDRAEVPLTVSTAAQFDPPGDVDPDDPDAVVPEAIAVAVDRTQVAADEDVAVTATVTGAGGAPVEGALVTFSVPGQWTVSPAEAHTDHHGQARTTVRYEGSGRPQGQGVTATTDAAGGTLSDEAGIAIAQ